MNERQGIEPSTFARSCSALGLRGSSSLELTAREREQPPAAVPTRTRRPQAGSKLRFAAARMLLIYPGR